MSDPARRTDMEDTGGGAPVPTVRPVRAGLSTKLLLLTALFVMLAEVLIFVPSVANFRTSWLMGRLESAQIASLAAEAAPDGILPQMLRDELLKTASVRGVALKRNDQRVLILSEEMPPQIDEHFDLRFEGPFKKILDALRVFLDGDGKVIRVIGEPGMNAGDFIEIIMPQAPLKAAMVTFALNILGLSVVISLVTAALVYLALNWLLVRPMRRLTDSMVAFSERPELVDRVIRPSGRTDEIGVAEEKLSLMQSELASMLQQRSRLAALGLAVSKINHDLRNLLASAQLMSDRIANLREPVVRQLAPKLMRALDRAISYCQQTLAYGRAQEPTPMRKSVSVEHLVEEVRDTLNLNENSEIGWVPSVERGLMIDADPEQMFRVLLNLSRNSIEALQSRVPNEPVRDQVRVVGRREGAVVVLEVADTGPGLPLRSREHLFEPFHGSTRSGGTGLGLAIAAEIVRLHGGEINLVDGTIGAAFRISIPDRPAQLDNYRENRLRA